MNGNKLDLVVKFLEVHINKNLHRLTIMIQL